MQSPRTLNEVSLKLRWLIKILGNYQNGLCFKKTNLGVHNIILKLVCLESDGPAMAERVHTL